MLKETHTVDYVGHSFPEVGWYGKICLFSLWILVVKSAVRIWIGLDGFFPSLTSQPTPEAPHNRTKYQQTTCAMQFSPCLFLHGFCPVFHYAERNHAVDYVGQSFPEVGWYGKTCLFSLWILVVKSAVRIWIGLDVFFHHSLRNQHQQHHTTAQNTSKQLAQCNFHHACSCMGSVLFSNMLKGTMQWIMLAKVFPRLVGTVKLVCTLCEFSWWKVQLEYG